MSTILRTLESHKCDNPSCSKTTPEVPQGSEVELPDGWIVIAGHYRIYRPINGLKTDEVIHEHTGGTKHYCSMDCYLQMLYDMSE